MKKLLILLAILLCIPMHAVAENGFFTLLLMGADEGAEEALVEAQYGRADAVMLVSINQTTGEVRMMSVERDYRVDLPGVGPTKLCIASYMGGPQAVLDAVNEMFGLQVDRYALISPEGIQAVVDAIGGVDVEIEKTDLYITKPNLKKAFKKAGMQHLKGEQVRAYVRTRTQDSDPVRNERQRKALVAIYKKAMSSGMEQLMDFVKAAFPHVDTNVELTDALFLVQPVLQGGAQDPAYARSPMTSFQQKRVKLHKLIVLDDPAAETQKVHEFLYGDL